MKGQEDMKVLVMDRNRETKHLVSNLVHQQWFLTQVFNAHEGQKGLRLVKEHAPDLVLLDMRLQDMDSLEFLRMLRDRSNAWIVMLTGRNQAVENARFLEEGADAIVAKPFSSEMLLARIRTILRRTQVLDLSSPSFVMQPMRAGERTAQATAV